MEKEKLKETETEEIKKADWKYLTALPKKKRGLKQYTIKELINILVKKGFSRIKAKAFIFDCLNYKGEVSNLSNPLYEEKKSDVLIFDEAQKLNKKLVKELRRMNKEGRIP